MSRDVCARVEDLVCLCAFSGRTRSSQVLQAWWVGPSPYLFELNNLAFGTYANAALAANSSTPAPLPEEDCGWWWGRQNPGGKKQQKTP